METADEPSLLLLLKEAAVEHGASSALPRPEPVASYGFLPPTLFRDIAA